MSLFDKPHRRYNPLTAEWVLVSPHRTMRPWQGQVEDIQVETRPAFDPGCYLCPGNTRAGGKQNPKYDSTFVFDNDYAALLPDTELQNHVDGELLRAQSERGICRVICFSPRHDLTLALMETEQICGVVDVWQQQHKELSSIETIQYVQIFENRGAMMGCSNPHPHGQIWASESIPDLPQKEDLQQSLYFEKNGQQLLRDYLSKELELKDRLIFENESFVALVPYWAVWPFETMLIPKRPVADLCGLDEKEKRDLSDALRRMCIRFDNLFYTSFPYSMGIHQGPSNAKSNDHWCFHIHFLPPLLRSATVKKFMVGYELLAMPQRDITAEQSAQRLRECSEVHFSKVQKESVLV